MEVEGTGFVRDDPGGVTVTCRFDGLASPATRWISAKRTACLSLAYLRRRPLPAVVNLTLGIIDGEEALTADHFPYTYLPRSYVASSVVTE